MSAPAENLVLVLNAGSSSLKFALFDVGSSSVRHARKVAATNARSGVFSVG